MAIVNIELLSEADRDDIIDVLAESFFDYPVFRSVLEDAEGPKYDRRLRLLIGFFADARLMRNWPVLGIREDGRLVAALLLSDPVFKPRPEPLNRVYDEVVSEIGEQAAARLEEFESSSEPYEPKSRTYFVGMIGVRPSSQGKGYGRMLMKRVEEMSWAHPDSEGVTLTTEVTANIPFYERLGYKKLGRTKIGDITTHFFLLRH